MAQCQYAERAAQATHKCSQQIVPRHQVDDRHAQVLHPQFVLTHRQRQQAARGIAIHASQRSHQAADARSDTPKQQRGLRPLGFEAEQRRSRHVEAVRTTQRVAFHQDAIQHHRQRQREHGKENAPVTGQQRRKRQRDQKCRHTAGQAQRQRIGNAQAVKQQGGGVTPGRKHQPLAKRDRPAAHHQHNAQGDQAVGQGNRGQKYQPLGQHQPQPQQRQKDQRADQRHAPRRKSNQDQALRAD